MALLFFLSACGGESSRCFAWREHLYTARTEWDACDPAQGPAQCIRIPGNPSDCSGVLQCDFAIHRARRGDVERVLLHLESYSAVCLQCPTPNCHAGRYPVCDPFTRRCLLTEDPPTETERDTP